MKTKFFVSVSDKDLEPIIDFEVPCKLDIGTVVVKYTSTKKGSIELESIVSGYTFMADKNELIMLATAFEFEEWMRERIKS